MSTTKFLTRKLFGAICAFAITWFAIPAFADVNYTSTAGFESDPATSWTLTGSTAWSTAQFYSGTHSVTLSGPATWNANTEVFWTSVNNVPQTGKVGLEAWFKFTSMSGGNINYLLAFGFPVGMGDYVGDLATIGINGSAPFVLNRYAAGGGSWTNTTYQIPLNTWIKIGVSIDQDAGTYDLFVDNSAVLTAEPLIHPENGKWGDASHKGVIMTASSQHTYFVDDVSFVNAVPVELSTFAIE
jgi:hypothetical protein